MACQSLIPSIRYCKFLESIGGVRNATFAAEFSHTVCDFATSLPRLLARHIACEIGTSALFLTRHQEPWSRAPVFSLPVLLGELLFMNSRLFAMMPSTVTHTSRPVPAPGAGGRSLFRHHTR